MVNGKDIVIEGKLTCKTKCFLYLLWSSKAPEKIYLGSSSREPKKRRMEHKSDIENQRGVAVAKHFSNTRSGVEDLLFRPFMTVKWSTHKGVLRHYETRMINRYYLVEEGVNKMLT